MSGQTLRVSKTIIDTVKTFYPNLRLKLSNVCWNPSDLEEVSHGGLCLTKSTGHTKNGNFQVALCSKDSSGQVHGDGIGFFLRLQV